MHIPIKLLCSIFSILMIVETTLSSPLQLQSHKITVDNNNVSQLNQVQANKMLTKMIMEMLKSKATDNRSTRDVIVSHNQELPEYHITSVKQVVDTDNAANRENKMLGLLLLEALSRRDSNAATNEQLKETVQTLSTRESTERISQGSDAAPQENLGAVKRLVNALL